MFSTSTTKNSEKRLLEEELYEQVALEIADNKIRPGIWAKALAKAEGSEEKAKGLYIKYRIESIKDEMNVVESTLKKEPSAQTPAKEISTTVPTIIYVLFLANFLLPFTGLIGVIMAYINKGDDNFLQSHYQFQIRTFWIGLLYVIVGALLTLVVIGWLVLIFYLIWLIVRCVKGFKYLGKQEPMPNPTSWMFG